jgi:hypothetical protein
MALSIWRGDYRGRCHEETAFLLPSGQQHQCRTQAVQGDIRARKAVVHPASEQLTDAMPLCKLLTKSRTAATPQGWELACRVATGTSRKPYMYPKTLVRDAPRGGRTGRGRSRGWGAAAAARAAPAPPPRRAVPAQHTCSERARVQWQTGATRPVSTSADCCLCWLAALLGWQTYRI